jgi:hypothetical protein
MSERELLGDQFVDVANGRMIVTERAGESKHRHRVVLPTKCSGRKVLNAKTQSRKVLQSHAETVNKLWESSQNFKSHFADFFPAFLCVLAPLRSKPVVDCSLAIDRPH